MIAREYMIIRCLKWHIDNDFVQMIILVIHSYFVYKFEIVTGRPLGYIRLITEVTSYTSYSFSKSVGYFPPLQLGQLN